MRHGNYLDAIGNLRFSNNDTTIMLGGSFGTYQCFDVSNNDCINAINVQYSSYVDSLTFMTSSGIRSTKYGTGVYTNVPKTVYVGDDKCLSKIDVRYGSWIDAIRFYFVDIPPNIINITSSYSHVGCYGDTRDRAMRHYNASDLYGYTRQSCYVYCTGYMYFGIQYGHECFCDNDFNHSTKYGVSNNCQNMLGGAWSNSIYYITTHTTPSPTIEPTKSPSTIPTLLLTIEPTIKQTKGKQPSIKWVLILIIGLISLVCCVILLIFAYILSKQMYSKHENAIQKQNELASIGYNTDIDDNKTDDNNSVSNENIVIKGIKHTNMSTPNDVNQDIIPAFDNEYSNKGTNIVYKDGNQPEGSNTVKKIKSTNTSIPNDNIPAFDNEYSDKEIIMQATEIVYQDTAIKAEESATKRQSQIEGSTQL